MILLKTVLVCCASCAVGGSSCLMGSCGLSDLMFFLVWCMWPLDFAIDGGRFLLIRSIVKFFHVTKYPLLIVWSRVYLAVLNSVVLKTVLVCCASCAVGGSSCLMGSCGLSDLMFFLVWCMWPLDFAIDGGRFLLIRSIVKFFHVTKYPLLIVWSRVYLAVLNSVVWYH